jgi:hypothetical protein
MTWRCQWLSVRSKRDTMCRCVSANRGSVADNVSTMSRSSCSPADVATTPRKQSAKATASALLCRQVARTSSRTRWARVGIAGGRGGAAAADVLSSM